MKRRVNGQKRAASHFHDRAAIFTDYLDGYVEIGRRRGRAAQALYDPTPVVWLAHPEWFTLQPARVEIELAGRHTRGMTVCDWRPISRHAASR